LIASNTKALSTLMLAKLVDAGRFRWDTPVVNLYPAFKLGNPDTTRQVLVNHLVCACTGMPRQDYEWLFEFKSATAASEVALLAGMQPTSKFGEIYQYSNLLASVAGFLGAQLLHPAEELGKAYDRAMETLVFGPLGMKNVTFEVDVALRANHASPHADDIDGHQSLVQMDINRSIYPLRPAGGAWASVRDLTRYVRMELAGGKLENGERYISEENLLARRAPNVKIGQDVTYGMGLETDVTWGVPVVHHGGSMIGYKSDMLWLPEQGVGAVILTNSEEGRLMLQPFMRRLLEILFDGKLEAAEDVVVSAQRHRAELTKNRERLVVPADPKISSQLARRYVNRALGDITVVRDGTATVFDFGEWRSHVSTHKNDDGTISFVTIDPGVDGFEFVIADKDQRRSLVLRDAQHEYVFDEAR
jgi:CubicO group peptidase (beta-lactamase class C family)